MSLCSVCLTDQKKNILSFILYQVWCNNSL